MASCAHFDSRLSVEGCWRRPGVERSLSQNSCSSSHPLLTTVPLSMDRPTGPPRTTTKGLRLSAFPTSFVNRAPFDGTCLPFCLPYGAESAPLERCHFYAALVPKPDPHDGGLSQKGFYLPHELSSILRMAEPHKLDRNDGRRQKIMPRPWPRVYQKY